LARDADEEREDFSKLSDFGAQRGDLGVLIRDRCLFRVPSN
jgi:hypothetical protein